MNDPYRLTELGTDLFDILCATIEARTVARDIIRADTSLTILKIEDAIFRTTPPSQRVRGEPIEEIPTDTLIRVRGRKVEIVRALETATRNVRA